MVIKNKYMQLLTDILILSKESLRVFICISREPPIHYNILETQNIQYYTVLF